MLEYLQVFFMGATFGSIACTVVILLMAPKD